jgi:hypothetical protein
VGKGLENWAVKGLDIVYGTKAGNFQQIDNMKQSLALYNLLNFGT